MGISDLPTVLNDIFSCRSKWCNLGIQLRVDLGTLDCFKHYSDPGDQLREVVRTWLTTSENPTWGTMVEALKSPSVGKVRLARELQQKYCSSGWPPVEGEQIHVTLDSQLIYSQTYSLKPIPRSDINILTLEFKGLNILLRG